MLKLKKSFYLFTALCLSIIVMSFTLTFVNTNVNAEETTVSVSFDMSSCTNFEYIGYNDPVNGDVVLDSNPTIFNNSLEIQISNITGNRNAYTPIIKNQKFEGWYLENTFTTQIYDGDGVIQNFTYDSSMGTELTLYPKFTDMSSKSLTITFDLHEDGDDTKEEIPFDNITTGNTTTLSFNEPFSNALPIATSSSYTPPTGYEFYCWKIKENNDVVFFVSDLKDNEVYCDVRTDSNKNEILSITVSPTINARSFKVSKVDESGNSISYDELVSYGSTQQLDSVQLKAGYNRLGWYLGDGTKFADENGNMLTSWTYLENKTIIAKYEAIEYTVTYNANGGTTTNTSIDIPFNTQAGFQLEVPTYEHYTFDGWYDDTNNTQITGSDGKTLETFKYQEAITITAHWTAIPKYTISYDGLADTVEVYYNSRVTLATITPDEHKEFLGWYYEDTQVSDENGNMIVDYTWSENITLTAKQDWKRYTITYGDLDDSDPNKTQTVKYGEKAQLYQGYTGTDANREFAGWMYDGNLITDNDCLMLKPYTYEKDINVFAYMTNKTYTISFKDREETVQVVYSESSLKDSTATVPEAEKLGYDFKYWYLDDESTPIIKDGVLQCTWYWGDKTLNPHFEAATFVVTYKTESDMTIANTSKNVVYKTSNITFDVPTKTGYNFTGWSYNSVVITDENGVMTSSFEYAENIEITANWQAKTYTIILNLGMAENLGGTISSKEITLTYGQSYSIEVPIWDGHVFRYWYNPAASGSGELTNSDGESISNWDVDNDNHTIFAAWGELKITLNKQEVYLSDYIGKTYKLSATINPENYTTATWTSSNTDVCTVDNEGNVRILALGKATITATTQRGAVSATCKIVSASFAISETSDMLLYISINGEEQNKAILCKANTTIRTLEGKIKENLSDVIGDRVTFIRDENGNKISGDDLDKTAINCYHDDGMVYINLGYKIEKDPNRPSFLHLKIIQNDTHQQESDYEYGQKINVLDISSTNSSYTAGLISVKESNGNRTLDVQQSDGSFIVKNFDVTVYVSISKIAVNNTDVEAQITATGDFDALTIIEIKKVNSENEYLVIENEQELVLNYNIDIYNSATKEEFTGTYTVKMAIPNELKGRDGVAVMYVDNSGKTIYNDQITFKDGYMSFDVSSLGTITFVANQHDKETNLTWLIILLLFLDVLGGMLVVITGVDFYDISSKNKKVTANSVVLGPLVMLGAALINSQIIGIVVLTFILGIEIAALIWMNQKIKEIKSINKDKEEITSRRNKIEDKATF